MNSANRLNYLYWAERRNRTLFQLIWDIGFVTSKDDAGYCLDRPDKPGELHDLTC